MDLSVFANKLFILKPSQGLHCVCPGQKGIHSNLGHLFCSLQSMGELASIMRKGRNFLITKMLQTISLHWNKIKYSFKILEPSILQSFHVVWNPYILNNICHSKPYQLDILSLFSMNIFRIQPITSLLPSLPSRQRDAIIRGVRPYIYIAGHFSGFV